MCDVCSSRKRSRPRGSSASEIGVARDHAVGMADRAMELQVERAEGGDRHRRHPAHHHRQRLAHVDRRIDVEPARGDQRRDQLELLVTGSSRLLTSAICSSTTRRRDRPAAVRPCRWRRSARRCRRCPKSAPTTRTPAPTPRSAAGERARAAGAAVVASGSVLKPGHQWCRRRKLCEAAASPCAKAVRRPRRDPAHVEDGWIRRRRGSPPC